MAAARERNDNPYEDGGGFGKFRKRPFRKVHNTPYDRPQTAFRNPSLAAATPNHSNGWLYKLVDPAQRLITSGVHKFFASVFRKRLPPPPPPQPPEPETNVGASYSEQEAVPKDSRGIQESAVNEIDYPASSSDRGGITELELILKQKTFTQSEIDHLTGLLQSRTVDLPLGIQEKNSEVIPSKPVLAQEKEVPVTPVKNSRLERYDIATPIVLDEDVATPAEFAKAYMGSRLSKVSLPVLGMHSSAIGEDSVVHINRPFPSKSVLSVVPRSSVCGVAVENGFVTPRSRGRSAVYNMARTPYSRLHSTSTLQGTGSEIDLFGAPSSSSQSLWENGGFSGSKHGALKRSSVFDNDMGSVGPIRRIRQKSNLLPSSGTLSSRGTGIASDAAQLRSSYRKVVLTSESITENGHMARGSGTSGVPSKSSEVASQILQQLDVLVPSRDKSPPNLSPSMLRGPALRSLDNIESSKFLETVQDNKKLDIRPDSSLPDTQKSVFQKVDKALGNGTVKPLASYEKSAYLLNGVDPANLVKNKASDVKSTSPLGLNSVAQTSPKKKRAFQISAHEDILELDDDDHSDKTPSATLSIEKEKMGGAFADNKASFAEASILENTTAFSDGKNQSTAMWNQKPPGSSDGFTVPDKNAMLTVAAASLSGVRSEHAVADNQAAVTSSKTLPLKEPNADAPSFNYAKKAVSPKEPNGFTPDFNSKISFAASTLPVVAGPKGSLFSENNSDNSSSSGSYAFDARKPLSKENGSNNTDGRNNLKTPLFGSSETTSALLSASPSTSSLVSFTGMSANASIMNGSIPTPSVSSADTGLVSDTVTGQISIGSSANAVLGSNSVAISSAAENSNSTSSLFISTSTPSFVSGSVFKFGSSPEPSASILLTSASAGVESTESEVKESSFGNLITSPFSSSLSPISSTGGSLFSGMSSAVKSTGNGSTSPTATSSNSFGISSAIATNGSSGIFSFSAGGNSQSVSNQSQGFSSFSAASTQSSSADTTFATESLSTPISFGTSASVPSFGFTASTARPSGNALFSSSSYTDKLFSFGASFGLTSSRSAANPVSSTINSTLSSSFPTPNFGSVFSSSSSTPFVFDASSASGATAASTSTAPLQFGSSANASPGSVFNFNSPATASPSQPVFGSTPNPSLTCSSSPGNNDQMNIEDSMAEDTIQATASTTPLFGQQTVTPPSSTFVFGSTASTGGNQFPSASASGVNLFQFGSQPNPAAPQNQLPFQASGSLEFNAGGSFSLGTGDKSGRKFVRVSKKNQRKK